jgi:hypothetical protein
MWRKEDVIKKLKTQQGKDSLRSYARSIGCSAAYLSDVYRGNREPGPLILDHLDLEKTVTVKTEYRRRRLK